MTNRHTAHALLTILANAANSVRSSVPIVVVAPEMRRNEANTGWLVSVAFEVPDGVADAVESDGA